MKGYLLKTDYEYPKPVIEVTTVGCKRCDNTWKEKHTFYMDIRVNGPMLIYDCCDKCKRDTDNLIDDVTIEGL